MAGGLLAAMLGMLGLEEKDVKDSDTLAGFGVDSMQTAEIRSRLQRALGRPIPLEEVSCLCQSVPKTGLHRRLLVCHAPHRCAARARLAITSLGCPLLGACLIDGAASPFPDSSAHCHPSVLPAAPSWPLLPCLWTWSSVIL